MRGYQLESSRMIRSFHNRETERIWNGLRSRKLPPDIQDRALDKLKMLNRASRLTTFATRRRTGCTN
jgi:plasmid maintenance system killer protein